MNTTTNILDSLADCLVFAIFFCIIGPVVAIISKKWRMRYKDLWSVLKS